jgi:hypothetical protein
MGSSDSSASAAGSVRPARGDGANRETEATEGD